MTAYLIEVYGCDATTGAAMHLTDTEFQIVSQVAAVVSQASTYGCEPTMSIRPATPRDLEADQ